MHLHEFLKHVHEILKPEVYLEIGVQYGTSLALAEKSALAVGIDPQPLVWSTVNIRDNQQIFSMTSDDWFEKRWHIAGVNQKPVSGNINLGFIDGLHLYEQALRDFMHLEQHMASNGVIIIDDVLPYNRAIAARQQPPGDWTGDVWKLWYALTAGRPDLKLLMVDTAPTGTLVVLNPRRDPVWLADVSPWMHDDDEVPLDILERRMAVSPQAALERIKDAMASGN
jgi:Methyltransferase domain